MSRSTHNLSNFPDYYFKLTTKQKSNWRKNTRKIERNEQLRSQFPCYHPSSNINVIHVHHHTEIITIDKLIQQAKTTTRYTVDTESQRRQHQDHGALVQIEMVHSINYSTVILMEIYHLPDVDSLLFKRIKELCLIIFNSGNEIITWGPFAKEFENFQHLEWMTIATTGVSLDTPADDDSDEEEFNTSFNEQVITWSLQAAVATALNKFLDKLETVNDWNCGLDLALEIWRSRLFSKRYYDMQVEKQQRIKMIDYAIHDCTSVTEIYFKIYPWKANISKTISNQTPQTTSTTNYNIDDNLSDINETPLSAPQFEPTLNEEQVELTVEITEKEAEEFNKNETSQSIHEQEQIQQEQTTTRKSSKQEQQRRKNQKLKWKQRNRPDFQNKIKRPIYYKYDYRKIRSQLLDDDIHTSHQITIDKRRREVIIGFKSHQEQQRATSIMRINYFSRAQFKKRSG